MFELNIAIDKLFCITQKQCQILLEHPSLIRLRGRKKHHGGKYARLIGNIYLFPVYLIGFNNLETNKQTNKCVKQARHQACGCVGQTY